MSFEPKLSKENKKLLNRHPRLNHATMQKVNSHVQRKEGDWIINTLLIDGYDVPFRYKRKEAYRSLNGARVNLTYYANKEAVAGFEMEVMSVVKVVRS